MKRTLIAICALLALALPASAKEELTVYTYDSFVSEWGPGAKIKEAFEQRCDCTLTYVAVGDGVMLLNRLKLEGSDTAADIVLGLDTSLMAEAAETGLFAPNGLDKSLAKTPLEWSDDRFLPFDYAYFAVIYDSEKVTTPPHSLAELVEGDPTQKIILQDPRSSTPGLGFLLWMKSVYGEGAADAWKKLSGRILTFTPGWSEAYSLFLKGEAPLVLSYSTSPAYHQIVEGSERYKAALFSEGHYLQIEVAGMIAGSKEEALARQFLEFMLSPAFQDEIPTGNWMLPAGATSQPLPPAFAESIQPSTALLFSPQEVAAQRRVWIDEWLNATSN